MESFVCSTLGLKSEFMAGKECPDHYTIKNWVLTLLENKSETLKTSKPLSKELLESLGFDPSSAAVETLLKRSFEKSKQNHFETCEWAALFIEDEFRYNPFLRNFEVFRNYFETSKNFRGFEPSENLLFHGTDHQSASDILHRGIDLCAGRQKRDFSSGSGFYLTDKMDEAADYARSITSKPVVLVFRGDKCLAKARKLKLSASDKRWQEIVSSFRSGERTVKTRKSLMNYDVIEGPMATVTINEIMGDLVIEPKVSSWQLAIISDDFAEKFEKSLETIVYLNDKN